MKEEFNHIDQELLVRYLLKETSEEESLLVENWLNYSEENRIYFEEIFDLWKRSESLSDFEAIDVEADWKKVKAKIPFESAHVIPLNQVSQKSSSNYFLRIAASLLLIVGLSFMGYWFFKSDMVEVATADDEKEIVLPDGSKVFLNSHSRLAYKEDFKKDRSLTLSGEAFFEVVKDPTSPFRVKAKGTITKVLGTSFNVKSTLNEQMIEITLLTGRVAFYEEKGEKQGVELTPGEQLIYSNGKISKSKKVYPNVLAWKNNKLLFEDSKLSSVINDLEAYFKIHIEIGDSNLLNCRYTGQFSNPKLDKVLSVIQTSLNASVQKQGDKYIIEGEGCEE